MDINSEQDIDKFVIEQLYDLVSAPDQYDNFMLSLQSKLEEMRGINQNYDPEELDTHLERASHLVDIITPWETDRAGILGEIPEIPLQPILAVNIDGKIIDSNVAARNLYNLPPNADLSSLPLSPADLSQLRERIKNIITGHQSRNNPNDVISYKNTHTGASFLVRLEVHTGQKDLDGLVIVKSADIHWPSHLGPILRDLFNLSVAEVEVLSLLVRGERVEAIAQSRQISMATVRTQLRAIYAKTNTSNQMECVRLILGLALMHTREEGRDIASQIVASSETNAYPRPKDRHVLQLKNGKQLDYAVFGERGGLPVLFYHDQVFGDTWFPENVRQAKRLGLQIISILRPGYGRTTLYETKTSDPAAFAPDVVELLDHLGIKRAAILAMRAGFVHGAALTKLIPERINTILVANPILPVRSDADLEGTNGYNRLIPHTRKYFPQALRFLVKSGFAFVTSKGPEAFALSLLRASPKDVEWAARPEILPVLAKGRNCHNIHGYKGAYGDIAYKDDWSDLLRETPVPVRLAIGEHDRNVQWGASKRWAAEHDHIDLHILPNSGYLVLHQQCRQFLLWARESFEDTSQA